MSGNPRHARQRGWSLAEMMVAVAVFSIVGIGLSSLFLFGIRSMASTANYAILDKENRQAMDSLTREIRQARAVSSYSTNPPSLHIVNGDNLDVIYTFDPVNQQLVRDASDGSHQVLLQNCQLLNFDLRKRNPSNAVYGVFPVATNDWQHTVKAIELTWRTSLNVCPTANVNSESVQTARIVIRKAQTVD